VIDGVPPIEKTRITNERKNKYDLLDNKINEIFKENKTYSNKIITMSSLRDIIKYPYSIIISNMKDIEDVLNQEEMEELKNILNKRDELAKNLKQNLRMSKQEKKMLYDYLEKNSDLVIYAEGEAEKECAVLVNNKIASAVITRDTDILAYGCPLVIQSLIIFDNEIDCYIENSDIINDKLVAVSYENILNKLQLNKEEFLDLCILAGTDYNINIEGIGITNAYKLIKKYKNIENIIKYLKTLIKYKDYDFLSLNYLIVRKLFCFLHTI
jgi:5'-3' exonuclease